MTEYLFIDGAFFESVFSPIVKHMFPNEALFAAIDLQKLTRGYGRAFYYDALPAKKTSESQSNWEARREQKEALFNTLSTGPNLHVRSGISRYRRRRGTEQKGVDILLAIEALQHAMLGNIDVACFMLSDLDFYPVFEALIQTRVKSKLYYDPHKTSKDLIYAVDVAEAVNATTLNSWLRDDLRINFNIRRGSPFSSKPPRLANSRMWRSYNKTWERAYRGLLCCAIRRRGSELHWKRAIHGAERVRECARIKGDRRGKVRLPITGIIGLSLASGCRQGE